MMSVAESPTMRAASSAPPAAWMVRRRISGSGFCIAEGCLAADRAEPPRQPERIEQAHRQPCELVGAHREAVAAAGQRGEGAVPPPETKRAIGGGVGGRDDQRA